MLQLFVFFLVVFVFCLVCRALPDRRPRSLPFARKKTAAACVLCHQLLSVDPKTQPGCAKWLLERDRDRSGPKHQPPRSPTPIRPDSASVSRLTHALASRCIEAPHLVSNLPVAIERNTRSSGFFDPKLSLTPLVAEAFSDGEPSGGGLWVGAIQNLFSTPLLAPDKLMNKGC